MQRNGNAARVSGHVEHRALKRGGAFYAKYRIGRVQTMRKLGDAWTGKGRPPEGFLTRRMAEAALQAILTDARRGTLAGMSKTGGTFGDASAEWLRYVEHDRKRRVSTVSDYRGVVEVHLDPEFGKETPLEAITTERIDQWRARLVGDGRLSDRTVNKLLTNLHGIFERARRVYGLPSNPVAGVERQPHHHSGDFNVFSPSEVEALGRATDCRQDAAIFIVAAYSGLRMGELLALRWNDVDFEKRLIHVRRSYTYGAVNTPKSGRVRSVPLIDQAARALDGLSRRERFTDADNLVFPGVTGDYLDGSALRRRFKDALTRAGLKPLRFHDLRHSFGTLAVQVFPLTDVKAFMGHADVSTTMIYVHHVPQIDAAERLSRVVAAAGAPKTLRAVV
jgi:integrase